MSLHLSQPWLGTAKISHENKTNVPDRRQQRCPLAEKCAGLRKQDLGRRPSLVTPGTKLKVHCVETGSLQSPFSSHVTTWLSSRTFVTIVSVSLNPSSVHFGPVGFDRHTKESSQDTSHAVSVARAMSCGPFSKERRPCRLEQLGSEYKSK